MFRYDKDQFLALDAEKSVRLEQAGGSPGFDRYKLTGRDWQAHISGARLRAADGDGPKELGPGGVLWILQGVKIVSGDVPVEELRRIIKEAVFCIETEFMGIDADKLVIRM